MSKTITMLLANLRFVFNSPPILVNWYIGILVIGLTSYRICPSCLFLVSPLIFVCAEVEATSEAIVGSDAAFFRRAYLAINVSTHSSVFALVYGR